jgi:hypothetical protein
MTLVPEYTRRALTIATDILPALAGVVASISSYTGDKCLAGIWLNTLHIELLWVAYDAPHKVPRGKHNNSIYRAPSWSWAALEGESGYENYVDGWIAMKQDIKLVETVIKWAGNEWTSPLLEAKLIVEGLVETVRYQNHPSSMLLFEIEAYPLIPADSTQINATGEARQYKNTWAVFDQNPPPIEEVLSFLCICRRWDDEYWGILLQEQYHQLVEDEEKTTKTYRRIGLGRIILTKGSFGNGNHVRLTLI